MHTHETLPLSTIRIDGNTQPRDAIDESVVAEYAEAIAAGATFPPLIVYRDGANLWLVDGYHRYHAHRQIGIEDVVCDVRVGTQRDATLFSVGVNDTHGLRRSNASKRKAVMMLLADHEWSQWSRQRIADACKVSAPFVSTVRDTGNISGATQVKYVDRTGTQRVMDTSKIAESNKDRHRAAETPPSQQPATVVAPTVEKSQPAPPVEAEATSEPQADTQELADELEKARYVASDLAEEVETLRAASSVDGAEAEIKRLKAMLRAVEAERDMYRNKSNEMVKQIRAMQNKLAKLEKPA